MSMFSTISADQIMLSLLACYVIRELMLTFLPDRIAGPGGWLVDTSAEG